jgi:hypothetical protein
MAKASKAFLSFDIDGQRAAYATAQAFVEATDLRYGFSSKFINELGGSEKARLTELYDSDFEWCSRGPICVEEPPAYRVVVELYPSESPLAVENFLALCTNSQGKSKESGIPLHYKGSKVHRVVKGFMFQAGDILFGNGTGGESIWGGKKFKV